MRSIRRQCRNAVCSAMLVAPFWGGTALLAQSPPPAAGLQKGAVEVGAIFGTTLPVSWLRAHADRRLTMGSLDIGRLMTHQRGSGPLAGQFEFLLELTPFFAVEQPARTMGFTVSPLHMRWNFAGSPGHPVRPFAEASGGIVYTSDPVPVRTTTFNFIDQAGFGVRIGNGRPWWLAGYRFQHISNAGRVKPNPGANFNFAYVGVSFHR